LSERLLRTRDVAERLESLRCIDSGTGIEFSPQIVAPSPAIPVSTPPDPVEVTR